MNVKTATVEVADPSGANVLKRILTAAKDFSSGDVIYQVMCGALLTARILLTEWNRNVQ
jgi:hypothetical protein